MENAETISPLFHTRARGSNGPRKFESLEENHIWGPTWYVMDNVHGVPEFASSPPQRDCGCNTKLETMTLQKLTTLGYLLCRKAHMSRMVVN